MKSLFFAFSLYRLNTVHTYFQLNLPKRLAFKPGFLILQESVDGVTGQIDDKGLLIQKRNIALELLDCLTSPLDEDDPEYDVFKDMRRQNLLQTNDYYKLKLELKGRGLRTNGDILEMMIRLLLHTVDPSLSYDGL